MASVEEIRNAQRAKGPATILAIGTATPDHCVYQSDYADYYFKVTKSEHMTELKKKFNRICKYIHASNLIYITLLYMLECVLLGEAHLQVNECFKLSRVYFR